MTFRPAWLLPPVYPGAGAWPFLGLFPTAPLLHFPSGDCTQEPLLSQTQFCDSPLGSHIPGGGSSLAWGGLYPCPSFHSVLTQGLAASSQELGLGT